LIYPDLAQVWLRLAMSVMKRRATLDENGKLNWKQERTASSSSLSGLFQIDGLVAAVFVELRAPYLVRALMLGWTEADGRSQPHVEIPHGL
jgi:hypothetical protein